VPFTLDHLDDSLDNCALNLPAIGLLGLNGSLQKLPAFGLAELDDVFDRVARFGILSRPSAAAGSLSFSPNDSRYVCRVARDDRIDRGEFRW
jgi:hypothetical protein